jgi:hypothetical protein
MKRRGWLELALGVTTVPSLGTVTDRSVPLTVTTG